MYLAHWGLKQMPFESSPDTRFLFRSATHDAALAELLFAVDGGRGAALLAGPFGSGKTLLLRALLAGLPPDRFVTGRVGNALMAPAEVVLACARALGAVGLPERAAEVSASLAQDRLEGRLESAAAAGKRAVLAIDDAQVIRDAEVWEALRLVLGAAASDRPGPSLILAGESGGLSARLEAVPGFAERLAVRAALEPLRPEEVPEYLLHRLSCAGASSGVFTRSAAEEIARRSEGLPARINRLADRAMAAACAAGRRAVGPEAVRDAARGLEVPGTGPGAGA
jgi:MSHA biogenesis protein MshM